MDQQALTNIFDSATLDVINSSVAKEWKVKLIVKIFEEVAKMGWENYSQSDFWLYEVVQEAFNRWGNQ